MKIKAAKNRSKAYSHRSTDGFMSSAGNNAGTGRGSSSVPLGPQIVIDGGFDKTTTWAAGLGWSYGYGIATGVPADLTSIEQDTTLLSDGVTYQVRIEMGTITAGTVLVEFTGGTPVQGPAISTEGVSTFELVAALGNDVIAITKDALFDGDVLDISVREVKT